ncbi:MAG: hypothetical protein AAF594_17530 [Bacteroidota bacterium]
MLIEHRRADLDAYQLRALGEPRRGVRLDRLGKGDVVDPEAA